MAQKKKTSKNRNTRTIPFKNFIKNPITWVVIGALCFGVYHFGSIWYEKRQFQKLDQQAYGYIQAIAQKYPGKVTHEQYCDYSSMKFSKGVLGCTVRSGLAITANEGGAEQKIIGLADEKQRNIFKNVKFTDTTHNRLDNMSNIKNVVYEEGSLTCGISYRYGYEDYSLPNRKLNKKTIIIDASCSGNTRAEHYPVR